MSELLCSDCGTPLRPSERGVCEGCFIHPGTPETQLGDLASEQGSPLYDHHKRIEVLEARVGKLDEHYDWVAQLAEKAIGEVRGGNFGHWISELAVRIEALEEKWTNCSKK